MGNNQENTNLERARARLEQALLRLSENAQQSKQILSEADAAQGANAEAYQTLEERFRAVEQENLRLHEKIAALSLSTPADDTSKRVAELEADKHAVQQNYDLLKRQYTSLQDEFEGLQDTIGAPSSAAPANTNDEDTAAEIYTLRSALDATISERDIIKQELDQVIDELETYLAQNNQAAGGMN